MRKLSAALIILLGLANAALAQTVVNPQPNAGNYGAYNLALPTCTTGLGCWLQTDINGRLIVVGAGGTAGSVTQGTVPWVVSGQGTAGTAATGVVTVQGIAAMTPFLTTTTLNAETTKVIGTVNQGTSPWVVSGTVSANFTPSSSSSIGITPVVSAAAEASHVLKAGAGNVYSAYANNFSATTGWLVLLNSTSAPADGAITPLACALLAPNGVASINYAPGPPGVFSTGITAVVTSGATCFTKTTGTITAFISGSVQ